MGFREIHYLAVETPGYAEVSVGPYDPLSQMQLPFRPTKLIQRGFWNSLLCWIMVFNVTIQSALTEKLVGQL